MAFQRETHPPGPVTAQANAAVPSVAERQRQIPATLAPAVVGIASLNDFQPKPRADPREARRYSRARNPSGPLPALSTANRLTSCLTPCRFRRDLQHQSALQTRHHRQTASRWWRSSLPTFIRKPTWKAIARHSFPQFQVGLVPPVTIHWAATIRTSIRRGNSRPPSMSSRSPPRPRGQGSRSLPARARTPTSARTPQSKMWSTCRCLPTIISVSVEECEAGLTESGNQYINYLYQQAASEGTSVYVSSSDSGAAGCDNFDTASLCDVWDFSERARVHAIQCGRGRHRLRRHPTWEPMRISESSTNGPAYGSAKKYIPEIPWNDSCASTLISNYEGYAIPYGPKGFCASDFGQYFQDIVAGSGGPSGCASGETSPNPGTPAVSGT